MQEPTIFAPLPSSGQRNASIVWRRQLLLALLAVLAVVLIGSGISWLQWAARRSVALGYPAPQVHITRTATGTALTTDNVAFSASGSGRDISYFWTFGDGDASYAYGRTVSHTFQRYGDFTVTVYVTDAIDQSSTDTTTVHVMPPLPTASFTYQVPYNYYYYEVTFDASASTAGQGTSIASYNWDFGDGSSDRTGGPGEYHYYSSAGTYTVTLTVTDGAGQTGPAATVPVTVS